QTLVDQALCSAKGNGLPDVSAFAMHHHIGSQCQSRVANQAERSGIADKFNRARCEGLRTFEADCGVVVDAQHSVQNQPGLDLEVRVDGGHVPISLDCHVI